MAVGARRRRGSLRGDRATNDDDLTEVEKKTLVGHPQKPMFMKIPLFLLATLIGAFFLAGCGDDTPKLTGADLQAFDGAPAEVKAAWDQAVAKDKANDYAAAGAAYFSLLRQPGLSEAQLQAVRNAAAAMNQRLYAAAAQGDAAAQQAIQKLQSGQPGR